MRVKFAAELLVLTLMFVAARPLVGQQPSQPAAPVFRSTVNLILVAADRILPTLAEVIAAVGPEQFARRRVALVTGPSRTADIEKMIVIGVHGPKELYAAVIAA